jgi:hypothetical protein
VKLRSLKLDNHAKDKLLRLVKERYNPETDVLTIVSERCPLIKPNVDYPMYLQNVLVSESWVSPNVLLSKQQLRAGKSLVIDTSSFFSVVCRTSRGRMRNAEETWKNICGKGASRNSQRTVDQLL